MKVEAEIKNPYPVRLKFVKSGCTDKGIRHVCVDIKLQLLSLFYPVFSAVVSHLCRVLTLLI